VSQIPGGGTPDSTTAKRQLKNLQDTQSEMMAKYPEEYGNYKKEKPYVSKAAATPEPPKGATNPVFKSATDKTIIGHMVNGQYVPLAQ